MLWMKEGVKIVYLLHFDRPYEGVQHYVGYTDNIKGRMKRHKSGNGSKLIAAVTSKGIGFKLVKVWEGDRSLERKIKNYKNSPKICPICNPNYKGQWSKNI